MNIITAIDSFLRDTLITRLMEIITSPITHPHAIWTIIPLVITLFFAQLYFGRWKKEKLGWNSAFANTVALLFITVNLAYHLSQTYNPEDFLKLGTPLYKAILVGIIVLEIGFTMTGVYLHSMSKKVSFFLGSPTTINTIAFIAIVLVYSEIPLDIITLISFIIIYIAVQVFCSLFRAIIPTSKEESEED